jgi:hypothetical protein
MVGFVVYFVNNPGCFLSYPPQHPHGGYCCCIDGVVQFWEIGDITFHVFWKYLLVYGCYDSG